MMANPLPAKSDFGKIIANQVNAREVWISATITFTRGNLSSSLNRIHAPRVAGGAPGNAAPKAAQHAEAKYGKTDYPFYSLFLHTITLVQNVWTDC